MRVVHLKSNFQSVSIRNTRGFKITVSLVCQGQCHEILTPSRGKKFYLSFRNWQKPFSEIFRFLKDICEKCVSANMYFRTSQHNSFAKPNLSQNTFRPAHKGWFDPKIGVENPLKYHYEQINGLNIVVFLKNVKGVKTTICGKLCLRHFFREIHILFNKFLDCRQKKQ